MSTQITLALLDDVYQQAEYLAQMTGRDVGEVLRDTIEISLRPLGTSTPPPLQDLSDAEVLALTNLQLPPSQDERLSELLSRQQADQLTLDEQTELTAIMQVYQEGLLRKARALREAVQRGLLPPLEP